MADENVSAGTTTDAATTAAAGTVATTDAATAAAAATAATTAAAATAATTDGATEAAKGAADKTGDKLGWGETWRADYAGKDEKLLKRLERYASPKAAIDALVAAQNRINSGELKAPLPENATAEQLTAWRKENGIPVKPADYLENLPKGLVIGDADKPLFEDFTKGLHELNADPKIAQYAVKWYNELQEKNATAQIAADEQGKVATEDALRSEWGNDYRTNINSIHGLLDGAPKQVSELILNARAGDGKAIMNDPAVVRWLVGLAREINPVHSIVPGSGSEIGKSVSDEIDNIEKMMKTDRASYNKDEKIQARYRELIDARDRLKGRAA